MPCRLRGVQREVYGDSPPQNSPKRSLKTSESTAAGLELGPRCRLLLRCRQPYRPDPGFEGVVVANIAWVSALDSHVDAAVVVLRLKMLR